MDKKLSIALLLLSLPAGAAYSVIHPTTAHAQSTDTPVYYTYHSLKGSISGVYNNIQNAIASLANYPGGVVKNSSWVVVYKQAVYHTYNNSNSTSSLGSYPNLAEAAMSLEKVPGGVVRNQSGKIVFTQPDTRSYYFTYSSSKSNKIMHAFTSIQLAVSSLSNQPGAIVKNQSWEVVYRQPPAYKFFTYHSGSGSIAGVYTSLRDAALSLKNYPGGVVKNSSWVPIFTEPSSSSKYFTYSSPQSSQIIGMYSSVTSAIESLKDHPGGIVKNQNWAVVYQEPKNVYFTYNSRTSSRILSMFHSKQAAVAALANTPGGIIKNSLWQVVYVQPKTKTELYFTYSDPTSNKISGMYSTLTDAIAAIHKQPGAVVKNSQWERVYQQPTFRTYTSSEATRTLAAFASLQAAVHSLSDKYGAVVRDDADAIVFHQPQRYFTYSSKVSDKILGMYWSRRDAIASLGNLPGGIVKNAQWEQVYMQPLGNYYNTVDLRFPAPKLVTADQINVWLTKNPDSNGSPLQGLGNAYMWTQAQYGVNAIYLLSHSIIETGWGKSYFALARNNLFGFAAYTNAPSSAATFPSPSYAIEYEGWFVRHDYLTQGASFYVPADGPTLLGMAQHYADAGVTGWADPISSVMQQYVTSTEGTSGFVDYPQYLSSNQPPEPANTSTQAPIYQMKGALATFNGGTNYSRVPIVPDTYQGSPGYELGASLMYQGPVKDGDVNATVRELQTLLEGAGYNPQGTDGDFGPNTLSALQAFQSSNGIPTSQECGAVTWQALVEAYCTAQGIPISYLSASSGNVTVDGIVLGKVGSNFVQWYHVPNKGWVDSQYVSLTNVRQIEPTSFTSTASTTGWSVIPSTVDIPLYSAPGSTLKVGYVHGGDYVVFSNAGSNYLQVTKVGDDGTLVSGAVKSSEVKLLDLPNTFIPLSK